MSRPAALEARTIITTANGRMSMNTHRLIATAALAGALSLKDQVTSVIVSEVLHTRFGYVLGVIPKR